MNSGSSETAHQLILDGLRALTERVSALDQRITDHMALEERETEEISRQLKSISSLVSAMPLDKYGAPDYHGHRTDHENQREFGTSAKKVVWDIRTKLVEYLILGLFFAIASGHFSKFFEMIIK